MFCHFRLSSCLIYNGVAYFGGCLDFFDQFETLKLLNIFSIEGLVAYFQLVIKKLGVIYQIPGHPSFWHFARYLLFRGDFGKGVVKICSDITN